MDGVEALYYEKTRQSGVRCLLCPNDCRINPGKNGRCRLRWNDGGKLIALSYGHTVTAAVDPIEKKPLYHFMPGSRILSVGPNGCTLTCDHCQNWEISQCSSPVRYISPGDLVDLAADEESSGVAFTYTEPLLWYEYLLDASRLLRKRGLKTVIVTNGYLNEEPARQIAPMTDAFNIDLKSFDDGFYRKYCGGTLEPVKKFIEIASSVAHVELTNLVIPGLNDSLESIEEMAKWISGISREIPLHFSRFFPRYKMGDVPATSGDILKKAYDVARRFLDYVYIGNIFIEGTEDTVCPDCGEEVIKRSGYSVEMRISDGICRRCGKEIKGVWK
ncbi:MAG: AmmeMemoRadiSam system radical SAM enzyme [Candidatus Krumholzibacteriota bacterium]|nr:AmmeMemoRadiSam system radical SAM enzyme [Candidatus Krumholzibacteriota bacterium]